MISKLKSIAQPNIDVQGSDKYYVQIKFVNIVLSINHMALLGLFLNMFIPVSFLLAHVWNCTKYLVVGTNDYICYYVRRKFNWEKMFW